MASFVAINPNNSYDLRVFDQLLFLEKLRNNEINCEMASSFINSSEFNSILKEFKRKKQQEGDQKKWEIFLEKKQQEEVNKTISGIKATFSTTEHQKVRNNNFNCESLNSVSNGAYYESETEYTNHWLEDNHFFFGRNFHDYEENGNKCLIYPDLNESSLSINNDYQSEHLIFDEQNTTNEMQYHYSHFQNKEIANDFHNITEQSIFHCDEVNNLLNPSEHNPSLTSMIKIKERKGKSLLLLERNPEEFQSHETITKLTSESEAAAQPKKEDNASSILTGSIEISLCQKTSNGIIKDVCSNNAQTCNKNEPEENYCKNVAKRIQDIPGVDTELRKVEDIRIKMTPILSNIRIVIAKNFNSPLSADEDLERIKQRTLEFGARFKRNYLYRTNFEVNKLKEMMPSPILISKKSKIISMIQKLTVVHHAAIQALQVIEKQLQTISIFGKTQELLCSFYNCIFELTLILKPFYGYLKTQVLDEVEKHIIETIKLLSELKSEEKFSMPSRGIKDKKGQFKSSIESPPWMKKSAALARLKFGPPIRIRKQKSHQGQRNKVLEPKQSKDSIYNEQGEKLDQEQDSIKPVNFMMSVKQRPGAELRRANFNPIKPEEPKTMIEIISREGAVDDNLFTQSQKNKELLDIDPNLCFVQTSFSDDNKMGNIQKTSETEKMVPRNCKLICIKSEDDNQKENMTTKTNVLEGDKCSPADENIVQYDELIKYRRAFKKYKKNIPLYEKNTLNTVVSMSETFLEETIAEVSKEINKMKISDLLGIVDEFENCEADLDSST